VTSFNKSVEDRGSNIYNIKSLINREIV